MEAAFDAYFRAADLDHDGRISGQEAVAFFKGSGLPQQILAQIWTYSDKNRAGFLGREDFYNSLKLVTVAQSGRQLTPEVVKSALFGPAAAKIPAPRINISTTGSPTSNVSSPSPAAQVAPGPSQQNPAVSEPQRPPSVSLNPQVVPSSNSVRPPQALDANTLPTRGIAQKPPLGDSLNGLNHTSSTTPNLSTDWFSGTKSVDSLSVTSQAPSRSIPPQVNLDSIGISGPTSTHAGGYNSQTQAAMTSIMANSTNLTLLSSQPTGNNFNTLAPSGNGFSSDSTFGVDPYSANPQAKQDSPSFSFVSNSLPGSTALNSAVGHHHSPKPTQAGLPQGVAPFPAQASQLQQNQPSPKPNQFNAIPSSPISIAANVSGGQIPSNPSQPHLPWPKITQADVRKYMIVFIKVDKDRDGKITGEEARNLFLSWRLTREILRKVWELSDQDKDGMLSFREFCTAVYLMERHREQRPLPDVLPDGIWAEGISLPSTGQFSENYSGQSPHPPSGYSNRGMHGLPPGMPQSSMKPSPRSPLSAEADDTMHAGQKKPKIPVLEKHLVDQLSNEEQEALNSKFKEASDADKKVQDLEKEILDSKEKTGFYRTKMQELILYKSRCDNRLNEISERMSADKSEVQSLSMKYDEKCKKVGDVASKLTMDEATFREIQEKKLEIYNAIVKLQKGDGKDEKLQGRANQIQSDLEELVKTLNEQCKRYGLKAKPTTLVELPFGWQPGIQETAAVWDEEWDKFGDDGFAIIKELTVEVEPPTVKDSASIVDESKVSANGLQAAVSTDKEDNESDKSAAAEPTTDLDSVPSHSQADSAKSPLASPVKNTKDGHTEEPAKNQSGTNDASPCATESISESGGAESSISGDKNHDEHSWGPSSDHGYDHETLWNFNHKEGENGGSHDLFFGTQGLPPIKTGASTAGTVYGKEQKPFFDSVPSTPMQKPFFDSVPSTPMQKSVFDYSVPSIPMQKSVFDSVPGTPIQRSVFDSVPSTPMQKQFFDSFPSTPMQRSLFDSGTSATESPTAGSIFGKEQKGFFDSVPSTPMYNSSFSPRYSEAGDDNSFDNFSQYDSFGAHENNLFGQRDRFSRFDSFQSTADHDSNNTFARFDSFHSTTDQGGSNNSFMRYDSISNTSDHNRSETFARFDSMKSTSDHSRGFSFDDDPFGTAPFKSSGNHSPTRHGADKWSAF